MKLDGFDERDAKRRIDEARRKRMAESAAQKKQTSLSPAAQQYVQWVYDQLESRSHMDKRTTERRAGELGITRQVEVKELTELAVVLRARTFARMDLPDSIGDKQRHRYDAIVDLYNHQVNLSFRTSQSILLQQYSTPAPLGYLMGLFCQIHRPGDYFEPSAGNGLLVINADPATVTVNEVDELRFRNLSSQGYAAVTDQDATKPFPPHYKHRFDAMITNPPFGRLSAPIEVGPATIKDLDHWMAINALECVKDDGRAAIIVGGHTEYDTYGAVRSGKNRSFINYLYHHYNVVDTINVDGDIYKRQGTGFDVRIILLNGRKAVPKGLSRTFNPQLDGVINDFSNLYDRITGHLTTLPQTAPKTAPKTVPTAIEKQPWQYPYQPSKALDKDTYFRDALSVLTPMAKLLLKRAIAKHILDQERYNNFGYDLLQHVDDGAIVASVVANLLLDYTRKGSVYWIQYAERDKLFDLAIADGSMTKIEVQAIRQSAGLGPRRRVRETKHGKAKNLTARDLHRNKVFRVLLEEVSGRNENRKPTEVQFPARSAGKARPTKSTPKMLQIQSGTAFLFPGSSNYNTTDSYELCWGVYGDNIKLAGRTTYASKAKFTALMAKHRTHDSPSLVESAAYFNWVNGGDQIRTGTVVEYRSAYYVVVGIQPNLKKSPILSLETVTSVIQEFIGHSVQVLQNQVSILTPEAAERAYRKALSGVMDNPVDKQDTPAPPPILVLSYDHFTAMEKGRLAKSLDKKWNFGGILGVSTLRARIENGDFGGKHIYDKTVVSKDADNLGIRDPDYDKKLAALTKIKKIYNLDYPGGQTFMEVDKVVYDAVKVVQQTVTKETARVPTLQMEAGVTIKYPESMSDGKTPMFGLISAIVGDRVKIVGRKGPAARTVFEDHLKHDPNHPYTPKLGTADEFFRFTNNDILGHNVRVGTLVRYNGVLHFVVDRAFGTGGHIRLEPLAYAVSNALEPYPTPITVSRNDFSILTADIALSEFRSALYLAKNPGNELTPQEDAEYQFLLLEMEMEAEALLLLANGGALGYVDAKGKPQLIDDYGIPQVPAHVRTDQLGELLSDEDSEDIFQAVADRILTLITQRNTNQQRFSRTVSDGRPHNYITGEAYKSTNALIIRDFRKQKKIKSDLFVEQWDLSPEEVDQMIESDVDYAFTMAIRNGRAYEVMTYSVEHVPSLKAMAKKPYDRDPIVSCDSIIDNQPEPKVRIKVCLTKEEQAHLKKIHAYGVYTRLRDYSREHIEIYPMDHFRNAANYYSVLFHELIHASGAPARLFRNSLMQSPTSKKEGAKEELVAELGAAFLCAESGILYQTAKINAGYVDVFLRRELNSSPAELLNAIAQAQRAADYQLGQLRPETIYESRMKKYTKRLQLEREMEAEALALLNELGMPYIPASESCNRLNVETPDAMAADTSAALLRLKARVRDVDDYVREKLGYASKAHLCDALSAEQIDAVALAIDNIERLNQGIIIGDQTGIGKGRQAAAMIRYARETGVTPVFFTEKPNLFSDLYRDLVAIGSGNLRPFILNAREDKTNIRDNSGKIVHQALDKLEQDKIIRSGQLPSEYDFVITTYTQLSSAKKDWEDPKKQFIANVANGSVVVLDESHNASGNSNTGKTLAGIVRNATGVVYLSGTFAKRPDNMYIYAMKTAMQEASMSPEEMAGAFARGGVALQEVVAGQLVSQGQMVRRQRAFDGIEVNYIVLDETAAPFSMPDKSMEHRAVADEITRIIRRIIAFQLEHVYPVIADMDKGAKEEQGDVKATPGTKAAGVDTTPYFSKVFNVINQMLFSIKSESVADRAIQRLREGKKPVIAFSSTMGSFVEELYEGSQFADAEQVVNADFVTVLQRGLDGVMKVVESDGWGKTKTISLSADELYVDGQREYADIARDIRQSTTGLVLSPIDLIKQKIKDAGFTVAEVTGRKLEMEFYTPKKDEKGTGIGRLGRLPETRTSALIRPRKKENVSEAFRKFNNNEVDCLLINQSGSTGASAHAIATPKVPTDQVKQRVMIVLQAELDINTEVQKRGRVNRTGQIYKPIYDYVISAVPAEARLMMMLKKKLKSLDANTSSDQKNSADLLDSDDFLNKYGDDVVTAYLEENGEINAALGNLLDAESSMDMAHRASGRVAVLPTEQQQAFYDEIKDNYEKYIRRLKERDEYDLEVEVVDLKAKPLGERKMFIVGKTGNTGFGDNTYVEKMEVNNLRKPYKPDELANMIESHLAGNTPGEYAAALIAEIEEYSNNRRAFIRTYNNKKLEGEISGFLKSGVYRRMNAEEQPGALEEYKEERFAYWTKRYENQTDRLDAEMGMIKRYATAHQPGRRYFSENTDGAKMAAVLIGWSIDRKKKNVFDLRNVDVLVAVAGSRKIMTLGMSNPEDRTVLGSLLGHSSDLNWEWTRNGYNKEYLQTWWQDQIRNAVNDRVNRFMITGNLLQAYKSSGVEGRGKIVTFTTIENRQRRGIILPDTYSDEPKRDVNGKLTVFTIDVPILKGLAIIRALPVDKMIECANGLSFIKNSYSTYKLLCPSRLKAIITDEDIGELLLSEDGFQKVGNAMVGIVADTDLERLCTILQNEYNTSIKLTEEQLKFIADQIKGDVGDDFLPQLPNRKPIPAPAPAPAPKPAPAPADDDEEDADFALLMLEMEMEAEALLLLSM